MIIKISWEETFHPGIVPVFLPFMGCKKRCVFCAQNLQTGMESPHELSDFALILKKSRLMLHNYKKRWGYPAELAFYGGTFTMLPKESWKMCIEFANSCLKEQLINEFRCSTRPDALEEQRLATLRENGCHLIELGIQSFNTVSLRQTQRGYDCGTALSACKTVGESGFKLGIQLLPGMPGQSPANFLEDVRLAISTKAELARFYPCLVIANTALAEMWKAGKYKPWNMEETIEALSDAYVLGRNAGMSISRIGLAPDVSLYSSILAGPAHPSLGSRIMAFALYKIIALRLAEAGRERIIRRLYLPSQVQGFFWGWRRELKDKWEDLGVDSKRIDWVRENHISMDVS